MHNPQTGDAISGAAFWSTFGFDVRRFDPTTNSPVASGEQAEAIPPGATLGTVLPAGVIAFSAPGEAETDFWEHLKSLGAPPRLVTTTGDIITAFFAIAPGADAAAFREAAPARVAVHLPGDAVRLPSGERLDSSGYNAQRIADLEEISPPASAADVSTSTAVSSPTPVADPVLAGNPLRKFSLLGHAATLEASAKDSTPLLGNVALAGQATLIYAPPNAGKTLIVLWLVMQAIEAGRIEAGNVYYVNADDSSSGAAAKLRLLEDIGAHMLVPGWQGFNSRQLLELIRGMVSGNKCRGVLLVVDTLKKGVDLMDKRSSAEFADAVRMFVGKGGTFIGLAHTNKFPGPNGKLVYAGTTDFIEDGDAACVLTPLPTPAPGGDKVVTFQFRKRRGDNVDESYAYADGGTASYAELVASVRLVDAENLDRLLAEVELQSDQPVIDAVAESIREGVVQKMLLAKAAAARARVSVRTAIKVIERYQGEDPAEHRWSYSVQERGAKVYKLLSS